MNNYVYIGPGQMRSASVIQGVIKSLDLTKVLHVSINDYFLLWHT